MTKQIGLLGLMALGFLGCNNEKVESEDIRTSGIYAVFGVLATGNGKATASAELRVGGDSGTIVELTGEDKLTCTATAPEADPNAKTLAKDGNAYQATFSGEAGDTEFLFALSRGDEDEGAPNSSVTMPDPFAIAGVTATEAVSRATALTVTWDASATKDSTKWTLNGSCLFETHGSVADDGSLTLEGDDYNPTPSAEDAVKDEKDDSENCTATLCIEKKRKGSLDPAFAEEEGGEIYAVQRRCVKFVSTP